MATDWEATFKNWAQPPSVTERDKCANAESVLSKALRNDPQLANLDFTVFTQGSYHCNTNVRMDSDVDINVRLNSVYVNEYPDEIPGFESIVGFSATNITYTWFKNELEYALKNKFGSDKVNRGKKSLYVHENTYRIDADIVPTFRHRRYIATKDAAGNYLYYEGVTFFPDDGGQIINWPDQTYANGAQKNNSTRRGYKASIRILKRLRNKMQAEASTQLRT